MQFKAIGFDYDGVIETVPGLAPGEFSSKVGEILHIDKEKYRETHFKYNKDLNLGRITWEEFLSMVLKELGKSEHLAEVLAFAKSNSARKKISDEMLELARNLKLHGFKTGILSNNSREVADRIRKDGLGRFFDVIHVSAETGFVKPEAQAFLHFAEALGADPQELIFIDDSEKSLTTASIIGYTPILFKSYDLLLEDLKRFTSLFL